MSRQNGMNYLRSAGNTNDLGRLSFGYFALAKQRKVTRQQAKSKSKNKT
jgi:hypothetical protein